MQVQNPFSIAGWPLTWYYAPEGKTLANEPFATAANTYTLFGFSLPARVRFNTINIICANVASPGLYSVGLYSSLGALKATSAPAAVTPGVMNNFAVTGAPITIDPGSYYLATTGNNVSAQALICGGDFINWTFFYGNSLGATVGGALPATIVPPAQSIDLQHFPLFALSI